MHEPTIAVATTEKSCGLFVSTASTSLHDGGKKDARRSSADPRHGQKGIFSTEQEHFATANFHRRWKLPMAESASLC